MREDTAPIVCGLRHGWVPFFKEWRGKMETRDNVRASDVEDIFCPLTNNGCNPSCGFLVYDRLSVRAGEHTQNYERSGVYDKYKMAYCGIVVDNEPANCGKIYQGRFLAGNVPFDGKTDEELAQEKESTWQI